MRINAHERIGNGHVQRMASSSKNVFYGFLLTLAIAYSSISKPDKFSSFLLGRATPTHSRTQQYLSHQINSI